MASYSFWSRSRPNLSAERGAETVVVDGVSDRLECTEAFGADHAINLTERDTAGANDAIFI